MRRRNQTFVYVSIIAGLVLLAWGAQRGANWYTLSLHPVDALHDAVQSGNIDDVKKLLSLGADPNAVDEQGQTPLHILPLTSDEARPEILALLLNRDLDLDTLDDQGYSPLANALESGDIQFVKLLLDAGANPNVGTIRGNAPLTSLLLNHNSREQEIAMLIKAGADIGIQDAILLNDVEKLKVILSLNPKTINETFELGTTPLMWATMKGNLRMVKYLLDTGADPNAQSDEGYTALYFGHRNESGIDALRLLLLRGANPNAVSDDGRTPLHNAAALTNPASVKLLLDVGADPLALDEHGSLPIHYVRYHSNAHDSDACFELLLDAGSPVDKVDIDGRTPLFPAAIYGSIHTVNRMLDIGADPNHQDNRGNTPLIFADAENVLVLVGRGANPNAISTHGKTSLHHATEYSYERRYGFLAVDIAKVNALLSVGADPMFSAAGKSSVLQKTRTRAQTVTSEELKTLYIRALELMDAAVAEREGAKARP